MAGSSKTVTVELNLREVQVLRGLIVREAKRLNYDQDCLHADQPHAIRRMMSVARKIWDARQQFHDEE